MINSFSWILAVQQMQSDGLPDIGVRISAWFIGMFALAIVGALLYLRDREKEGMRRDRGGAERKTDPERVF